MKPEEQQQIAFDNEMKKELSKVFPSALIPPNFELAALRALEHQSLTSLGVDADTYDRIEMYLEGDLAEISFREISFLINAIGSSTKGQLSRPGDIDFKYSKIQRDIIQLSIYWNNAVDPIKDSVRRRVQSHIIRGLDPNNNGKTRLKF